MSLFAETIVSPRIRELAPSLALSPFFFFDAQLTP